MPSLIFIKLNICEYYQYKLSVVSAKVIINSICMFERGFILLHGPPNSVGELDAFAKVTDA